MVAMKPSVGRGLAGRPSEKVGCSPIVSFDEQRLVLRVAGDEDRTTQSLRRRPLSRALLVARDLTVDLSEVSFADTSLMVDLAMLAQRLRRAGRTLVLLSPPPHIERLIELVGLDRMPAVRVAAAA
jgi:anti-anti-sigma factor